MAAGRPTDYKPEFCQMMIDHCAKGYSFESTAGLLKIHKDTLYEWVKTYPEFSDAKKIATDQCRLFWEGMAINNMISSTSTERDGNKSITESKALNSAVWVFNMKNRFGWTDRREITVEEKPQRLVINKKEKKNG